MSYRVPHENIDISAKTSIHVLSYIKVHKVTKMVIQVDTWNHQIKKISPNYQSLWNWYLSIIKCADYQLTISLPQLIYM